MLIAYLLNQTETSRWWLPTTEIKWTRDLHTGDSGQLKISYQAIDQIATAHSLTVSQLLTEEMRKIVLYDENQEEDIFKGVLTSQSLSGAGLNELQLTLNFADARVLLTKILTASNQTYTAAAIETVAENLLTQAQTKYDWGLSVNNQLDTGVVVNRQFSYSKVADALLGLETNKMSGGLEFYFDAHWVLQLAWPQLGTTKEAIVFDDHNILQFSNRLNLTGSLTNRVYLKGKTSSIVSCQDAPAQTIWGIAEGYVSATDLSETSDLTARAQAYLGENSLPKATTQIDLQVAPRQPAWIDYEVGDWLRLKVDALSINENWRLVKRIITVTEGDEKVNLSLSQQAPPTDFASHYREVLQRLARLELS